MSKSKPKRSPDGAKFASNQTSTNAERETAIAAREKGVRETIVKLLGPCGEPFDPEQAKTALEKKLADAEKAGRAIAEQAAKKEYETKKAIDDATAATNLALLTAENARFKADNAKLEAEVKRLSEVNTNLATRTGDLALGAFNAAGGLQSKATESLQAAAQSGQRPLGR